MWLQPCHVWRKPTSEGRHKWHSFIYWCANYTSGKFHRSRVLTCLKKWHSITVTKGLRASLMATLELYSQSTGTLSKLPNLSYSFIKYISQSQIDIAEPLCSSPSQRIAKDWWLPGSQSIQPWSGACLLYKKSNVKFDFRTQWKQVETFAAQTHSGNMPSSTIRMDEF